jgi:hypothetical protein
MPACGRHVSGIMPVIGHGAVGLEPRDHLPIRHDRAVPCRIQARAAQRTDRGTARPLARPAMGGSGCQTLMPVRGPDR